MSDTTQQPEDDVNEVEVNEVSTNEVAANDATTQEIAPAVGTDPLPLQVANRAPDYTRDHPNLGSEVQEEIHRVGKFLGASVTRFADGFVHFRFLRFFGPKVTDFHYTDEGKHISSDQAEQRLAEIHNDVGAGEKS